MSRAQRESERQRAGKTGPGKIHDTVRDQAAPLDGCSQDAIEQVPRNQPPLSSKSPKRRERASISATERVTAAWLT